VNSPLHLALLVRNAGFHTPEWTHDLDLVTLERMSILSDHEIRHLAREKRMIDPFVDRQVRNCEKGKGVIGYGLSSYGYDLRVADEFKVFTNVFNTVVDPKAFDSKSFVDVCGEVCIVPPNSFALARSIEYFRIPRDLPWKEHVCAVRYHCKCDTVRAGVGGTCHSGDLEHHAVAGKDLRQ